MTSPLRPLPPTVGYAVGGAAAGCIVGSFLPWVKISAPFVGTISKAGMDGGDGIFTLIIGAVIALLAVVMLQGKRSKAVGPALIILGLAAVAVVAIDGHNLAQGFADAEAASDLVSPSYGSGLWLIGISGATAAICGLYVSAQP